MRKWCTECIFFFWIPPAFFCVEIVGHQNDHRQPSLPKIAQPTIGSRPFISGPASPEGPPEAKKLRYMREYAPENQVTNCV